MTPADKQEPVACPECGHLAGEESDLLTIAYMSGVYDERKARENGLRPTSDLAERIEGLDELALRVATDAHRGQVDKGGKPYIWHPIRVAAGFRTEALRAVALLHDVLEDSALTADDLEKAFGPVVADAVVCLTRKPGQSYSDFIRQCAANPMARAVKLRDLADNMDESRLPQPLTASDVARLAKYTDASAILTALKEVNSHDRT